jgi:hypothetical protein
VNAADFFHTTSVSGGGTEKTRTTGIPVYTDSDSGTEDVSINDSDCSGLCAREPGVQLMKFYYLSLLEYSQ